MRLSSLNALWHKLPVPLNKLNSTSIKFLYDANNISLEFRTVKDCLFLGAVSNIYNMLWTELHLVL